MRLGGLLRFAGACELVASLVLLTSASAAASTGDPMCEGRQAERVGGDERDIIVGTSQADVIVGGDYDRIFGKGGAETRLHPLIVRPHLHQAREAQVRFRFKALARRTPARPPHLCG